MSKAGDILILEHHQKIDSYDKITIQELDHDAFHYIDYDTDRDASDMRTVIVDLYYDEGEDPNSVKKFLDKYNNVLDKVKKILKNKLGKLPYIDRHDFIRRLLKSDWNGSKFFPITIYVSSSSKDKMTVGLNLYENGKAEMFEGNDEATPETYDIVNKLLGLADKEVMIWGQHGSDLVMQIKRKGIIPKGIYVSPKKSYAQGYFDLAGDRNLFSGKIKMVDINQESEYDWITNKDTNVKNVRIF